MPIDIIITQEHIDKGIRHNPSFCPIAWAVRPLFQGMHILVASHLVVMDLITRRQEAEYALPFELFKWRIAFDRGEKVEPVTFREIKSYAEIMGYHV